MTLTIAICVQIKTIESATNTIGTKINDNSNLRDELLSWQGKYEALYRELENKEKQLEEARKMAVANNQADTNNETEIKNNRKLLGLTEVSGPGYIITLDENREVNSDEVINISGYLVHEEDVLAIVNELFNAGADAVSINGQRIINSSSILCDGNIIRINRRNGRSSNNNKSNWISRKN